MLTEKEIEQRKQIKMICIEDLVPANHLLRKIEASIDFSFIRKEVKELYSLDNGRPSIDPIVLFKLSIINYMYGLNSMRRTIRETEVNMAYRWFLGYDIMEQIPHFSTWGKNYKRRFEGSNIFETIFARILGEAIACNLVDTKTVFIDGSHIKANANTKKNYKEEVKAEAKHYHKKLLEEINAEREENDKKPFDDGDDSGETKIVTKSKTDPESGLFHKGEHKKCFAYTVQTACDRNNFILGATLNSGNVHDSVAFDELYNKLKTNLEGIENVVVDAGYMTPWIAKQLIDDGKYAVMPYHAPMTKEGFFKKREYKYLPESNRYVCPNGIILKYTTTNREGYKEYKSNSEECKNCPNLKQCTESKNTTKVITRHIWADYLEQIESTRLTEYSKSLYRLRSETIERVFADAKEKYGLRYAEVKGKKRVMAKVLLTFACQNLKKLANMKEKLGLLPPIFSRLFQSLTAFLKNLFFPLKIQKQFA